MTIFGVILLVVAVVLFFVARNQAGRLHAMNAADTYTAQLLNEVHTKVTTSLDAEAFAQPCEVEGVIEADEPLTGPLSNRACVGYTRTVTREYEDEVTEEDDEGKRETRMERGSETVESEDQRVNFWVRDATGRVLINPEGADLDMVETADRYEDAPSGRGRSRTLGYRYVEKALLPGTKVYILGCAVDFQGQPIIAQHPKDSNQHFFVSRKTERELAQSAAGSSRNLYYVSGALGVLGLVLLVVGVF
jgi:hypothetical protein